MPRLARCVFANVPHHITQRGNRKEEVFFTQDDRNTYLSLLNNYCDKHSVDIIAYCLMTNHIHLVAVPTTEDGLEKVLRPLHMRYTQMINRKMGWNGHLWQGRYFSSPLDEEYFWACIRYIENNPVRAKIVDRAGEYRCHHVKNSFMSANIKVFFGELVNCIACSSFRYEHRAQN